MPLPRIPANTALCICAFLWISCSPSEQAGVKEASGLPPPPSIPDTSDAWVQSTLSSLTLEEKVGQLIMARMYGHYLSTESEEYERLERLVQDQKVGGLVVFQGDVYETAVLLNRLQKLAAVPLLVAGDFERGAAMRIRRSTYFPEAMAIGATRNPDYAYFAGKATAEEARAIGVHQNLAPVADVNNNPQNPVINTRSFGEDPSLVSEMVEAYVRGTLAGGAVPTVKHFPGHGDTGVDSHLDLPVLPFDRARLDSVELMTFRSAIAAGVGSVMIAHLEVPTIDPGRRPATLSPQVVTGLLRSDFGFSGLVVTDAMEMRGILKTHSVGESAVMAVKAGVDVVLIPADEIAAAEALVAAVRSGELAMARIDSSVTRILDVKHRLGLTRRREVDIDRIPETVASESHQRLAKDIARDAITVLRNEGSLLPIRTSGDRSITVLLFGDSDESRTDVHRASSQLTNEPFGAFFLQQFRRRSGRVAVLRVTPGSNRMEQDSVLQRIGAGDLLVIAVYAKVRSASGSIGLPPELERFVALLSRTGKPSIVAALGNPYVLSSFPFAGAVLCTYSDAEAAVEAAVEAMFGESDVTARLPVTIPGSFAFGEGLTLRAEGIDRRGCGTIDSLITSAIHDSVFPGCQVAVVSGGEVVYNKSFGRYTYEERSTRVTAETMYDLASVTKVVATTSAAMKLHDAGLLRLDDPVSTFLPRFSGGMKDRVTVRHLLDHSSGLPAYRPLYRFPGRRADLVDSLCATPLAADPGDTTVYSDVGMMLLGEVIRVAAGRPLDDFVSEYFFRPLGMNNTMFSPPPARVFQIAPTELDTVWRKRLIQGTVHDENADALEGIAGHAGLFSTASDLSTFMQMLLRGGVIGDKRYVLESTIREFTRPQPPDGVRALGWDMKSPAGSSAGDAFSESSYGHTGFTGTSIWVDPERDLCVIILTNRVYPTRENHNIGRFRPRLHNAVVQCLAIEPEKK
jgi:beta-glucosidase-like glycosyl hydrolase/CubicO group peptidase (beta-lactamase class C family)